MTVWATLMRCKAETAVLPASQMDLQRVEQQEDTLAVVCGLVPNT